MSKIAFPKPKLLRGIIIVCIVLLEVFVLLCNWTLSYEVGRVSEYDVKAAFLLNFVRFIDWPDRTRDETGNELILGIAGEDHFGDALNLIQGKTIKGKKLVIKNGVDSSSFKSCQILFISSSEKDQLSSIMAEIKNLPILTISEVEGFAQRGGMINFIMVENKILFEINPDAAKQVGIHISSQLLQLARIVTNN